MHEIVWLSLLILAAAMLYSSVGHAGATGYLAAMALFGVAPELMKPTALALNILVASIGTWRFYSAGCFEWTIFLPFAAGSVPAAFLGGQLTLPTHVYHWLLGGVLWLAAVRLILAGKADAGVATRPAPIVLAIVCGIGIGFVAGLTGIGGGVFLSPLLVLARWTDPRKSAGISAAFILVNSVAGIVGHLAKAPSLPAGLPCWAVAAVAGGLVGSHFGSRRFDNLTMRRLLGVVLVIAGAKQFVPERTPAPTPSDGGRQTAARTLDMRPPAFDSEPADNFQPRFPV